LDTLSMRVIRLVSQYERTVINYYSTFTLTRIAYNNNKSMRESE